MKIFHLRLVLTKNGEENAYFLSPFVEKSKEMINTSKSHYFYCSLEIFDLGKK